jgi:hypothetical protein
MGTLLLLTAWSSTAYGQLTQISSVMNGFGGRSSGGTYTHVGAGAQPGGIGTSYENGPANYQGGQINRAGFLNTFVFAPGLDANQNGIPDELDPDNDGDGLWDHWELSGEQFSPLTPTDPNRADTDGNNISDFEEMLAGTNPTDPEAGLNIISMKPDGLMGVVTWQARGNNERIYVLRVRDNSYDGIPDIVIWSNTVAGGFPPWYAVTNTISEPLTDGSFYAVEVIKP